MTQAGSFRNHSDDQLLTELRSAQSDERKGTTRVLRILEEVDRRRLYADRGYPSLYQFCLGELGLSEHEAYLRMTAARAGRRFPAIFEMLERGDLHLTAIGKLAPHLTDENHASLLESAIGKTKREIEELLAARFPQPAVTESIRRLPQAQNPGRTFSAGPGENALNPPILPALERRPPVVAAPSSLPNVFTYRPAEISRSPEGSESVSPDTSRVPTSSSPAGESQRLPSPVWPAPSPAPSRRESVAPLAPDRYAVRFTASARCRELLERAKQLMSHRSPNADVAEIVEASLELLVEQLEKQKFKTTSRPRRSATFKASANRHIPAEIARAVHARDGGRCTFVGKSGHRCGARSFLEFDHAVPLGRGGETTIENLRLRCRAHNDLAAREHFGDDYIALRSQGFKPARQRPVDSAGPWMNARQRGSG